MGFSKWITNQWDRAIAIGIAVLGAVSIFLGWYGLSGKGLPSEQIPYLASGAVFGLFLLGVGGTLWLSADLRDEWRKLDQISVDIRDLANREVPLTNSTEIGAAGMSHNGEGVVPESHHVQ